MLISKAINFSVYYASRMLKDGCLNYSNELGLWIPKGFTAAIRVLQTSQRELEIDPLRRFRGIRMVGKAQPNRGIGDCGLYSLHGFLPWRFDAVSERKSWCVPTLRVEEDQ